MKTNEYTFKSLFNKGDNSSGINRIEIPKIQRDYAQGRSEIEVGRIRIRFLNALYKALKNKKSIKLDFVYGDILDDGVFIPLDGQQRLTTLFLLHWYAAKREQVDKNEYSFLDCFSYATRFSSKDFCEELINYSPDFSVSDLSSGITNQSWYPYDWKNDPTIQSMLTMLDAIHEIFFELPDIWTLLISDNIISFYLLKLKDMGLSDDLYIKMNSRGLPLNDFEQFKAELIKIIEECDESISKEIKRKLDVEWTDMFWNFRNNRSIVDDEFLRYIHFINEILCYQSNIEYDNDIFVLAERLYGKNNENRINNIKFFRDSFDCWHKIHNETGITNFFKSFFSFNYEDEKVVLFDNSINVFLDCCEGKLTLIKTLYLFSIATYLLHKEKITASDFRRRIRIIRNLILNSSYEVRRDRMSALLNESKYIILNGEIPSEKGELGYNLRQKKEEQDKINWLRDHPEMKKELFHLEDHHLIKGCIAVIGLENACNFKKFEILFNSCKNELIEQVLLIVGDYSQRVNDWKIQLCSINDDVKDKIWFDLFHPSSYKDFENTSKVLNCMLSMFKESEINNENLHEFINKYLSDYNTPKDWKYYFIKYTTMRNGKYGLYFWKNGKSNNPYEIIMMNTRERLTGTNWDFFLFSLQWHTSFTEKLDLGGNAYYGDKLKIDELNIEIENKNDRFVIHRKISEDVIFEEIKIPQSGDGIDLEDRILLGAKMIEELIKKETE